ncbi:hypothetical protein DSM106972_038740 [Dulcicalothrix desertica PCC 7102]|uniref:Uncharacterized protein n=1 Tax=Dulcicalothrix desertica PCC 7102 TaxID=232991 RepID=A0A3S1CN34_9CYAN|nr:hypothetical protein [Dulcicalothrix desertica]RUT05053.1 hypothetical protein DSM106972_038740 [Dulcicalothrix desertica PCC 7102]TWH62594.1 hypothetical protein CAL7102_00087 [Dulcicalothrix desertica PCC 7102]
MVNSQSIEFNLESGVEVGIIEKIPQENGNYQYEPYRGVGHLMMVDQVKAGNKAKCYVLLKGGEVAKFLVTNLPEYGVLQVFLGWEE